ncbi:uncharacterized protein LOC120328763 [Styela clava]
MLARRLTETGDLEKVGKNTIHYGEMSQRRNNHKSDLVPPPSLLPNYPAPIPPTEETFFPPPPPPITNNELRENSPQDTKKKIPTSRVMPVQTIDSKPPQLKLYADTDIRSLDKNPIHDDIMKEAEKFKDRRGELFVMDDDSNSTQIGEQVYDYQKVSSNLKPSHSFHHPVYDPAEMRRKKKHSLVVNSDLSWSKPKPVEKRNSYVIKPVAKAPLVTSRNAPMKEKIQQDNNGYSRIEDIPAPDKLLHLIATEDEQGNIIPEWKRKLMAQNYRTKLCKKFVS